jgi:DNA replication and repair protein RecF
VKVLRFSWKNFRNLCEGELLPCPSGNVICGDNAQGKTNLLEGMWLFTGERSFRGAKDGDLVRKGAPCAETGLSFYADGREQSAKIRVESGRRFPELNGVPKKSCAAIIGAFRAAVFSPEHLALLSGGPAGRRNFVDAALCQIRPSCAGIVAEYNRCLAERNALLKDIPEHTELLDTLPIWDSRLARAGQRLMGFRKSYLQKFGPIAASFYSGMCGGKETLELSYETGTEDLEKELERTRKTDLALGHTSTGPHRDDIAVKITGLDARAFGSQGQKRSAVIAMKLAEAELLGKETGEMPVIFLDDVLSELDAGRRDYLVNQIGRFQVFITCCESKISRMPKSGAVFSVKNGVPVQIR